MTLKNLSISSPLLIRKQIPTNINNIPGIWYINWKIGNITLFSSFYTRIDQACILWALISLVIFVTAQFLTLNWGIQAVLWSVLSLLGTIAMVKLTWVWVKLEQITWVLYGWVVLMLLGLVITDLSIFLSWGEMLIRLCPIWLGLSAIGYFFTGLGMRSPTFMLTGIIHLLGIFLLPFVGSWEFLTTGIVMGGSMLVLAEFEWSAKGTCSAGLEYHLLIPNQKNLQQEPS